MEFTIKKEKKIKFMTGLIAVILSFLVLMTPSGNAAASIKSAPYAMASQITEGSAKNVKAFLTKEALENIATTTIENIRQIDSGEECKNIVS